MLPRPGVFEKLMFAEFDPVVMGRRCFDSFAGKADMICRKQIFEVKFTSMTTSDHKLQTLLYTALLIETGTVVNKATGFLMNAKTNEVFKVMINAGDARKLLREAAESKAF